jgi:hypothetical protein
MNLGNVIDKLRQDIRDAVMDFLQSQRSSILAIIAPTSTGKTRTLIDTLYPDWSFVYLSLHHNVVKQNVTYRINCNHVDKIDDICINPKLKVLYGLGLNFSNICKEHCPFYNNCARTLQRRHIFTYPDSFSTVTHQLKTDLVKNFFINHSNFNDILVIDENFIGPLGDVSEFETIDFHKLKPLMEACEDSTCYEMIRDVIYKFCMVNPTEIKFDEIAPLLHDFRSYVTDSAMEEFISELNDGIVSHYIQTGELIRNFIPSFLDKIMYACEDRDPDTDKNLKNMFSFIFNEETGNITYSLERTKFEALDVGTGVNIIYLDAYAHPKHIESWFGREIDVVELSVDRKSNVYQLSDNMNSMQSLEYFPFVPNPEITHFKEQFFKMKRLLKIICKFTKERKGNLLIASRKRYIPNLKSDLIGDYEEYIDFVHYGGVGSRGSNEWQDYDSLCLFGIPFVSNDELLRGVLKYRISEDEILEYYTDIEIKQVVGRLREILKDKNITIFLLSKYNIVLSESPHVRLTYDSFMGMFKGKTRRTLELSKFKQEIENLLRVNINMRESDLLKRMSIGQERLKQVIKYMLRAGKIKDTEITSNSNRSYTVYSLNRE